MRVGNLEKNPPMDQEILQKHQSDTDFVSYSQAGICDWPWWLEQVPTKYLPKWWLIIQGDLYNKQSNEKRSRNQEFKEGYLDVPGS